MSIEVDVSSYFTTYTNNQRIIQVNGSTVGECMSDLAEKFPSLKKTLFDKNGQLYHYFDIYVNGESTYPNTQSAPVKDGDKLVIVVIILGG
jgi:molybdopterin converting factor small subunit